MATDHRFGRRCPFLHVWVGCTAETLLFYHPMSRALIYTDIKFKLWRALFRSDLFPPPLPSLQCFAAASVRFGQGFKFLLVYSLPLRQRSLWSCDCYLLQTMGKRKKAPSCGH